MTEQQNTQNVRLSRTMSAGDFAGYGVHEIAYVKPIPDDEGGVTFAIHAADGTPLTVLPDREIAFAVVRQNDLEPVSAH